MLERVNTCSQRNPLGSICIAMDRKLAAMLDHSRKFLRLHLEAWVFNCSDHLSARSRRRFPSMGRGIRRKTCDLFFSLVSIYTSHNWRLIPRQCKLSFRQNYVQHSGIRYLTQYRNVIFCFLVLYSFTKAISRYFARMWLVRLLSLWLKFTLI